ncbi:hypothetical protein [Streptomyces phaeochromogenes]|uniref:hypothetical protein n=1 Tax=Streptomyces phaeochromogenes TaxID=1923 RepID=UPI002E0D64EE|nr:hypothetical protein OG437_00045 [Streptomyces phaeochromogenes]WSJ11346.1 hypothetical protein OG437_50855 [Streptomyces phaeochromogenes]
MGKRQRRRNRQKKQASKQQLTVARYLYPDSGTPLLEVVFEPDVSEADKALCLDYWAFVEPGTWSRKVAEVGPTTAVLRTVRASCHADLLTIVCPDCSGPRTAHSRSDVTATRLWAPDAFPREETVTGGQCQACRDADAAEAAKAAERAAEEEQKKTKEQVDAAGAWLQEQAARDFPVGLPDVLGALTLLAMVEIMQQKDVETIGPLQDLNYTLTASASTDIDVLRTLHQERWICPALPATTGDFTFDEDGTVRGVYITQIPWQLAPSLGTKATARSEITCWMSRMLRASELNAHVHRLEAGMAVDYLGGLLVRKYNEEPIPEHRLPDAYETFLKALQEGFTLKQLVAVAWSSAAGSVAWGQRTPGLKPGSVSSASVTNLERRIGYARDRRIDEYDVPNWVPRAAIHATALWVREQHASEAVALGRFRDLKQRTDSRSLETAELDGDLEDLGESEGFGTSLVSHFEDLRAGRTREPQTPAITYALVTPDGELAFCSEPADEMRYTVGASGAGVVDRILLPTPTSVHAYVGELVTASEELANPVADEMLRLLDCHDGPFYGPISFFAVGTRDPRPRSLDEEQQEMLRAVHEVALNRARPH